MRIQILSDLHIEFSGNRIPALAPAAELVILAGDLAPVLNANVGDVAERWAGADKILYVPGNHEYYGSDIDAAREELARQCLQHGVTLLDPDAVTVDGVRFIGATLWTDFLLEGVADEAWAHLEVGRGLADFTGAIRHRGGRDGRFTTIESALRHAEHRAFIEAELEKAEASGLTPVVITHHAPSPKCIRPWFAKSRLNPGFASDLDAVIARYQPPLWVHGHMHDRIDERLGETRVVCNPGGGTTRWRGMSSTWHWWWRSETGWSTRGRRGSQHRHLERPQFTRAGGECGATRANVAFADSGQLRTPTADGGRVPRTLQGARTRSARRAAGGVRPEAEKTLGAGDHRAQHRNKSRIRSRRRLLRIKRGDPNRTSGCIRRANGTSAFLVLGKESIDDIADLNCEAAPSPRPPPRECRPR